MGAAISICANNASKDGIRSLWHQAARFEHEPSMLALNYPPHITFAIYDDIDQDALHAAARSAFAGVGPVHIVFDRIAHFDGSPLVLWATPQDRMALHELHRAIHDCLSLDGCREYYMLGRWVPHCTLAMAIPDDKRTAAMAFAAQGIKPFEVTFDSAECILFPPIKVTERLVLD